MRTSNRDHWNTTRKTSLPPPIHCIAQLIRIFQIVIRQRLIHTKHQISIVEAIINKMIMKKMVIFTLMMCSTLVAIRILHPQCSKSLLPCRQNRKISRGVYQTVLTITSILIQNRFIQIIRLVVLCKNCILVFCVVCSLYVIFFIYICTFLFYIYFFKLYLSDFFKCYKKLYVFIVMDVLFSCI